MHDDLPVPTGHPPTFLYPTSRQWFCDELCEQIVRALASRAFDVPGLRVSFSVYGSGEERMRHVKEIRGNDFTLRFGRPQGRTPSGLWNDCAAVSDIIVNRKWLTLHADNGSSLWLYVGDDWARDRDRFGRQYNSKLDGEPRTYLRYRPDRSRTRFDHDGDTGREYSPEGDEPTSFLARNLFAEVNDYLRELLRRIEKHPPLREPAALFPEPETIPWPADFGPLYSCTDNAGLERIRDGQRDPSTLSAAKRFAMGPSLRLLALDRRNDGTVSEIARDGFVWCVLQPEHLAYGYWSMRDSVPVLVRPRCANDCFVVDQFAYDRRRQELWLARPEISETGYNREEVDDFSRARARTLVPLHEYRGGYERPVVVIRRELGFDEVEVLEEDHR